MVGNCAAFATNTHSQQGALTVTLAKGTLTDGLKRLAYIADNYQFQFDGPPQVCVHERTILLFVTREPLLK
jgi:hypothetical protein